MTFKVKAKIANLAPLVKQLDQLKRSLRNKHLRRATTAAARILAKTARGEAPRETGLLAKSIGHKVKTYPSGVVVGIVGPRRNFKLDVRLKKGRVFRRIGGRLVWIRNPSPEMLAVLRNPEKYAHLVELGTAHSAPNPFLRRALAKAGPEMKATMQHKLAESLRDEAAKVYRG